MTNKELYKDFPNYNRFDYPSHIKRVTAGNGGESLLVFGSEKTALYDTGMAYCHSGLISNIEKELQGNGRDSLDYILISHTHYDHIGALPYVIERWPEVKVIASEKAQQVFKSDGAKRTMKRLGEAARDNYSSLEEEILVNPLRVDITVRECDKIFIGDEYFDVVEAKGHTDCSLAYVLKPDSIMFASESTGILRSPIEMHTAFLKSYEDTIKTARKCKAYDARHIISPHFGMIPDDFVSKYFDLYIKVATEEKNFVLSCRDRGLDKRDIYKEFEKRYWSEERGKSQPKEAFVENAVISINTILEA